MRGRTEQARWMRIVTARPTIAVTMALLALATATATATTTPAHGAAAAPDSSASVPTLGVAGITPNGTGFGGVRPAMVNYGGDPTSFVSDVKWHSWGGARAVGHGRADWVWPGWCVACGGVELPATVVAFGRTTCQGQSAYSYVEWYFPRRGMSFDRHLAGTNLCGARSVPTRPENERKCGHVRLRSGGAVVALADAITMYGSPISCATARRFVAGSGAARYLNRNARFHPAGWWCGSELSMDLNRPQSFSCVRGDFTNVIFDLEADGE